MKHCLARWGFDPEKLWLHLEVPTILATFHVLELKVDQILQGNDH